MKASKVGSSGALEGLGSDLRLAGNEGMEKKMETTIMGYVGITMRVHSFIPS